MFCFRQCAQVNSVVYGTLQTMSLDSTDDTVRLLTRQTTSIDESLVPFGSFDVKKIEEHVKNDFLHFRECSGSRREYRCTLVSREGIRSVSTMDLIAL